MDQPFTQVFNAATGWTLAGLIFLLVCVFPARVIQKRHGYSNWVLAWVFVALAFLLASQFVVFVAFAFVPILVPLVLLWAFALSTPKMTSEASS